MTPALSPHEPRPFRWGLALGVLVPLVVLRALFSPIAAFLLGVTAPVTVVAVAVTGIVCLRRGRTSRSADAVGFAIALAPILAAAAAARVPPRLHLGPVNPHPGATSAPTPPRGSTSPRVVPVVVGSAGAVNALALVLPGGWSSGVPAVAVGVAWLTLVVCFPLAVRHPVARDLGVAAAVSMLVGLAYVPVHTAVTLVTSR